MSTRTLPEKYRSALTIQPGWEIRTEDGEWVRVTAWSRWDSTEGKPPIVKLLLADDSECRVWAQSVIMTRRLAVSTPDAATWSGGSDA